METPVEQMLYTKIINQMLFGYTMHNKHELWTLRENLECAKTSENDPRI